LNLWGNKFTTLDPGVIPSGVQELDLSDNNLTILEVGVIPSGVQKLNLSWNKIIIKKGVIPSSVRELKIYGKSIKNMKQLRVKLKIKGIEI